MSIIKLVLWLAIGFLSLILVGFVATVVITENNACLFFLVKRYPSAPLVGKALWRAKTSEQVKLLNDIILNNTNRHLFSEARLNIRRHFFESHNTNYMPCIINIALRNNPDDFFRRMDALVMIEEFIDRGDTNKVAIVAELANRTNDSPIATYAWLYLSDKKEYCKELKWIPPQFRDPNCIPPELMHLYTQYENTAVAKPMKTNISEKTIDANTRIDQE